MFQIGQIYYSEAEPELGLGVVITPPSAESKVVTILFSATQVTRNYSATKPPIKRVAFKKDDVIKLIDDEGELLSTSVLEVSEEDGIISYHTQQGIFDESYLDAHLYFTSPLDKLVSGEYDGSGLFETRYQSQLHLRNYQMANIKGLLGAKIDLLPHQISITQELVQREQVRAMLADEVGLGKTIEACMVLKALVLSARAKRVLVLTPDALQNQWFVELYKKFHLSFKIIAPGAPATSSSDQFILGSFSTFCDPEYESVYRDFDLIIVDEVHQLTPTHPKLKDLFYKLKELALETPHCLFLSATPEILGLEGHFERLKLLDPERFTTFAEFKKEIDEREQFLPLIRKIWKEEVSVEEATKELKIANNFNSHSELLKFLIDCHGTGRVYFRNTRENLIHHGTKFPKRFFHPIALENEQERFSMVLAQIEEIKAKNPDDKILMLAASTETVESFNRFFKKTSDEQIALFHREMSSLEKDRMANFFKEQATLMLCSEKGSEGRNFEYANHLILMDLPRLPDQLEQRIGRLDRIGQFKDINLYVPYTKATNEEVFFKFYHEVLDIFTTPAKGGNQLYNEIRDELLQMNSPNADVIQSWQTRYREIKEALIKSHDLLIDLSSYNQETFKETVKEIREFREKNNVVDFLHQFSEELAINIEEGREGSYYVVPSSNMRIPSFPGLTDQGLSLSEELSIAKYYEHIDYLSFEHPVILTALDIFTQSEVGNCAAVEVQRFPSPLGLECFFKLSLLSGDLTSPLSRFLPTTPLRVLVSAEGKNITTQMKMRELNQESTPLSSEKKQLLTTLPKDKLKDLVNHAKAIAHKRSEKFFSEAKEKLNHEYDLMKLRLSEINKNREIAGTRLLDIESIELERQMYLQELAEAQTNDQNLKFDALRFVIKS